MFKLRSTIAKLISSLGFVHKDFWRLDGPIERLIFTDKNIFNSRLGYSNTLFNTNSGIITIGKNVIVAAKSGVTKNIKDNSVVAGFPAIDMKEWKKNIIRQRKDGH